MQLIVLDGAGRLSPEAFPMRFAETAAVSMAFLDDGEQRPTLVVAYEDAKASARRADP